MPLAELKSYPHGLPLTPAAGGVVACGVAVGLGAGVEVAVGDAGRGAAGA